MWDATHASFQTADKIARLARQPNDRRPQSILNTGDHDFLADRIHDLDAQYRSLTFPLGVGLIHNDAHPGDVLPDAAAEHGYLLIRDLHSLAGHIRAAPSHPAARHELAIRIRSLRGDDRTVRWSAV